MQDPQYRAYHVTLLGILEGDRDCALAAADLVAARYRDPEAVFYGAGRTYAYLGETEKALSILEGIVPGFFCVAMFRRDPWLDPLRGSTRFNEIVADAEARHAAAAKVWKESRISRP